MQHEIKKICSLNENVFTPIFLTLSKSIALTENYLLSVLQQFDLNTLFSRISLPFSNTLQQNNRSNKDALPIFLFQS